MEVEVVWRREDFVGSEAKVVLVDHLDFCAGSRFSVTYYRLFTYITP